MSSIGALQLTERKLFHFKLFTFDYFFNTTHSDFTL